MIVKLLYTLAHSYVFWSVLVLSLIVFCVTGFKVLTNKSSKTYLKILAAVSFSIFLVCAFLFLWILKTDYFIGLGKEITSSQELSVGGK